MSSRVKLTSRKFNRIATKTCVCGKPLEYYKYKNVSDLPNGTGGYRFRSSQPAAATKAATLEVDPHFEEHSKDTVGSKKVTAGILGNSNGIDVVIPPSAIIHGGNLLEEYIPPPPLKLQNSIDPKVLSQLYRPPLSPLSVYLKLSKIRLTTFVVFTSAAGYTLATNGYGPDLVWISLGTLLTSASAHTFNQIIEVDFDGQMDRTKNRVLVQKLASTQHAMTFGILSGLVGVTTLYSVNELCAVVGLANLVLYAGVYTPMKRMHMANTWVGSVVGALPPLIGCAGALGYIDVKAMVLSAIMYCWQFPHFNALSWNLRKDYDRAGYKMMCFESPRLCRHTTLRYSLLLTAICAGSPLVGVSEWMFVLDSGLLNGYLCYLCKFHYFNPPL